MNADKIVDLLNSACELDPVAIHALCINRVPCNTALADHPTIIVDSLKQRGEEHFVVGLIGILNGLLVDSGRVVAIKFADDRAQGAVGFCVVEYSEVQIEPTVETP